jgi:hypothetical protein
MRRTKSKSRLAFRSPFIRQVLVNAVTEQVGFGKNLSGSPMLLATAKVSGCS